MHVDIVHPMVSIRCRRKVSSIPAKVADVVELARKELGIICKA